MSNDDNDDDAVGYGKPPKHTRFKKGQSGNRKGRKPGVNNIATILDRAFSQQVTVNENGVKKKYSKLEAALIQQVNRAAGGDAKSFMMALQIMVAAEAREEVKAAGGDVPNEERRALNLKILAALKDRLAGGEESDA
jgi:hypothetical protein